MFLLLTIASLQVTAAPRCARKHRCGLRRHTICRDGVEVCAFFLQGGTCGPCADSAKENRPTTSPSEAPTNQPSELPSSRPSLLPTRSPSDAPTSTPSRSPSNEPSKSPSAGPSGSPTSAPTTKSSRVVKYLYWAGLSGSAYHIGRINLANPLDNPLKLTFGWASGAIAVHTPTGNVYYDAGGKIYRADKDLSNPVAIATEAAYGLAVDNKAGKVYWTNNIGIRRSGLNGESIETMVTFPQLGKGINVDPNNAVVYVQACSSQLFYRCRTVSPFTCEPVLGNNCGAQIGLDETAEKLYYSSYGRDLLRSDLDGSNPENYLTGGSSLNGVAASPSNGKVYWAAGRTINVASMLDSSSAIELAKFTGESVETLALSHP